MLFWKKQQNKKMTIFFKSSELFIHNLGNSDRSINPKSSAEHSKITETRRFLHNQVPATPQNITAGTKRVPDPAASTLLPRETSIPAITLCTIAFLDHYSSRPLSSCPVECLYINVEMNQSPCSQPPALSIDSSHSSLPDQSQWAMGRDGQSTVWEPERPR